MNFLILSRTSDNLSVFGLPVSVNDGEVSGILGSFQYRKRGAEFLKMKNRTFVQSNR